MGSAGIQPKFHGLRGNLDQAHRIPKLTRSPDLTFVWRVLVKMSTMKSFGLLGVIDRNISWASSFPWSKMLIAESQILQ